MTSLTETEMKRIRAEIEFGHGLANPATVLRLLDMIHIRDKAIEVMRKKLSLYADSNNWMSDKSLTTGKVVECFLRARFGNIDAQEALVQAQRLLSGEGKC